MQVSHSGWDAQHGAFHYEVYIDENKTDYELHYKNGMIAKQSSPFQEETRDWNHDDDVYSQFGAWFSHYAPDGSFSGGEFFTPVDLVQAAVDCLDPSEIRFGNQIIKVSGVEIPQPDKRPNLDERIAQNERRAMMQDIERNRKMDALGIRSPNEPWAR